MTCLQVTRLIGLWLLFVMNLTAACERNTNLVKNSLFESLEGWDLKQRMGMWKVSPATETQISIAHDQNDKSSLKFHPMSDKQIESLWSSQFIPLYNNKQQHIIKFSYHIQGKEAYKLKAKVDIAYNEKTHLFVTTSIEEKMSSQSNFSIKCISVPAYGTIRAIMVHFILEEPIETPIYLTHVDLQMSLEPDYTCDIYIDSFPKERFLLPNFLSPVDECKAEISIAVQMTLDRLPYLIETSQVWQGPISLSLLLIQESGSDFTRDLQQFVKAYYSNLLLYKYVRVHIVMEDQLNKEDSTMYPVNFLRNIAIKYVQTDYVFLLEGDISPTFSERQTFSWIQLAAVKLEGSLEKCSRCAFIAPLFHIKKSFNDLPHNKEELLGRLTIKQPNENGPVIEPFTVTSHAVVDYQTWYTAQESYPVEYRQDMEPYFIVHKHAPLMNSMYMGYGRDKCAYSRELYEANYRFIVLSQGFLLNKPHLPGSRTILLRSRGLKLRVFLTIAFHLQELKHGYITRDLSDGKRTQELYQVFRSEKEVVNCELPNEDCKPKGENKYSVELNQPNNQVNAEQLQRGKNMGVKINEKGKNVEMATRSFTVSHSDDINAASSDGFKCIDYTTGKLNPMSNNENSHNFLQNVPADRKEILVETLMKTYGTYTYFEVPSSGIHGYLRLIIALIHPDAVVSIEPFSLANSVKSDGVFYEYKMIGNFFEVIKSVRVKHTGPAILSINLDKVRGQSEESYEQELQVILNDLTDNDILLVESAKINVISLLNVMCSVKDVWALFILRGQKMDFAIMKNTGLVKHPPMKKILPPMVTLSTEYSLCSLEEQSTDIILFTKNRPMQTMSFLESLRASISGVAKVWVIYKADDTLFQQGYDIVNRCISKENSKFQVEFLKQTNTYLGEQLQQVFQKMTSNCVVFTVDEIIWLHKLNLVTSCCLLSNNPDEIASVQLRLGKNLSVFPKHNQLDTLYKDRFLPLNFEDNSYVYYPQHWPYDFGYLINMDGFMCLKQTAVTELGEQISHMQNPGHLESWWSLNFLHKHVKKWHVMFENSILVNNMYLADGRVAARQTPSQGSYDLCNRLVKDKEKIDVQWFVSQHKDSIPTTHVKKTVKFVKYEG